MNNFIFENPTKVYFGSGCVKEHLKSLVENYGSNVMLCYGGGSIKRNGIYDEVVSVLSDAGKNIVEFSGIPSNPTYSKVLEGAALAKESNADLILAVGGGSRVNKEHDDESKRDIALEKTTPDNRADYNTVFIGYPIWWGIAAWPVNGFVKGNDFTGKTVIPFCTSASSGLGQSGKLLAETAGTGIWQDGERFSSGASSSSVADWVNGLGL